MDPVPMAAQPRHHEEREEREDHVDLEERVEAHAEPEGPVANSDLVIVDTPVQSPVSTGRRGRRRVSSGGVITPSV